MRLKKSLSIILCYLLFAKASNASDTTCGDAPPVVSTEKLVETKLALSGLPKIAAVNAEIGVKYGNKVTSLITQFPNADQTLIRYSAWVAVCKAVTASTLPTDQKVRAFLDAQRELLPKPAEELRNAPAIQRARTSGLVASPAHHPRTVPVQSAAGEIDLQPIDVNEGADGWALRYLPSSPSESIKDPYFVIVQSPPTEEAGQKAIASLRSRFPQYDFALYGPYEGNKYWGIMMAAWVSRTDAQKVLAIAKSKVNPGAYLWHF